MKAKAASGKTTAESLLTAHVKTHFEKWGELDDVKVIWRLAIAFVRYRYRSSAEFAREAMHRQTMGYNELLNCRWAYEDQNPVAKQARMRADHDAAVAAIEVVIGPAKNNTDSITQLVSNGDGCEGKQ